MGGQELATLQEVFNLLVAAVGALGALLVSVFGVAWRASKWIARFEANSEARDAEVSVLREELHAFAAQTNERLDDVNERIGSLGEGLRRPPVTNGKGH